ncbi:MAG: ethanolamine ammonia-lyase subunit EutC [Arcicella sp.]|nr:ethanolamine ammonia-lyase subunit EutC [Arcicella sp.]
MKNTLIQKDNWTSLKVHTQARIALGNVGGSLPTQEVLNFKLAHAEAKDSIFVPLTINDLIQKISPFNLPIFTTKSRIQNRNEYLKRPDLGRRLDEQSVEILRGNTASFDLIFIITDGLSAEAVNVHAIRLIQEILPNVTEKYKIGIVLVEQGRVAIADEIGELLNANMTAIFIGERPGLSSPQSMGIYTTFAPKIGLTDERRNCISNIHANGLSYEIASNQLISLINQSFTQQYSGVNLEIGGLGIGEIRDWGIGF